ncbi:hypothetical protein JOQ06_028719, partial [Pogonophryne albipinna]
DSWHIELKPPHRSPTPGLNPSHASSCSPLLLLLAASFTPRPFNSWHGDKKQKEMMPVGVFQPFLSITLKVAMEGETEGEFVGGDVFTNVSLSICGDWSCTLGIAASRAVGGQRDPNISGET